MIFSKLISYNAATCSIEVWDRALWGKESESLTCYTRLNIQAQHRRLEKTVLVLDDNFLLACEENAALINNDAYKALSEEERDTAQRRLRLAQSSL